VCGQGKGGGSDIRECCLGLGKTISWSVALNTYLARATAGTDRSTNFRGH